MLFMKDSKFNILFWWKFLRKHEFHHPFLMKMQKSKLLNFNLLFASRRMFSSFKYWSMITTELTFTITELKLTIAYMSNIIVFMKKIKNDAEWKNYIFCIRKLHQKYCLSKNFYAFKLSFCKYFNIFLSKFAYNLSGAGHHRVFSDEGEI